MMTEMKFSSRDAASLFSTLKRPLFILDTETTGLSDEAEVWDVAWLRVNPDGTYVGKQSFLWIDLMAADPMALAVGHFWERSPQSPVRGSTSPAFSTPASVALEIFRDSHDCTLAGIVPSADQTWVKRLLREQGWPVPWHYKIMDIHTFATGMITGTTGQDATHWSTEQVCEALGLKSDGPDRHTAWGDVVLAFDMYVAAREGSLR